MLVPRGKTIAPIGLGRPFLHHEQQARAATRSRRRPVMDDVRRLVDVGSTQDLFAAGADIVQVARAQARPSEALWRAGARPGAPPGINGTTAMHRASATPAATPAAVRRALLPELEASKVKQISIETDSAGQPRLRRARLLQDHPARRARSLGYTSGDAEWSEPHPARPPARAARIAGAALRPQVPAVRGGLRQDGHGRRHRAPRSWPLEDADAVPACALELEAPSPTGLAQEHACSRGSKYGPFHPRLLGRS